MRRVKATIRVKNDRPKHLLNTLTAFIVLVAFFELVNFASKVNAKQIVIKDNNVRFTYDTPKKTVEKFLRDNDIELGEYDKINVPLDTIVYDGMTIEISRAVPIRLNYNGTESIIYTPVATVGDFLEQQDIKLTPKDDIDVALDTTIEKDLEIKIHVYDVETVTVDEVIPFGTVFEDSSSLSKGESQVKQQGQDGKKKVTYQIKYINGLETERTILNTEIIEAAVNKVVLCGTKQTVTVDKGKNKNVKQVIPMSATGYCNCFKCCGKNPGDYGYGVTASGLKTRRGVVAVDTSVIKLGTKLYIEGYGEAVAGDTGSAIKGNRIDLFFETHDEALAFGRRNVNVYVLAD